MKACSIVNPNSGSYEKFQSIRERFERAGGTCWETEEEGDGQKLAVRAAREGFDPVVAVGGDGTVNEVVNGLMTLENRPRLGILPFGTGNDLARTLALLEDPDKALDTLFAAREVPLDVFTVEQGGEVCYGVNVAAGGFSGTVGEVLSQDFKKQWGPLAYLLGAVKALPEIETYETYLRLDDEEMRVSAYNLFVANGRTVAGGKCVSPSSFLDDGLLDVVVVRAGSKVEMAALAARFAAGQHMSSALINHYRVSSVSIRSTPGLHFNVDGELIGEEPITFRVVPHALVTFANVDYPLPPGDPG